MKVNFQKIFKVLIFLTVFSMLLALVVMICLKIGQSGTQKCNCNPDGSITLECNAKGICTCKVGFTGSKCDECKPNIIGDTCKKCRPNYFNYPLCQECQCDPNASTSLECDANGHCACKDGFSGKKCNACKGGFTGSKCDECKPNVIGDKCDACEPHYFNYPTCQECNCNPDGSITLQCDTNGDCTCKNGFTGSKCDECKSNVIGAKCDACQQNYFDYPSCQDCKCDLNGSTTLQCDVHGDCNCREGFTGSKCGECKPNVIGDKCDACEPNYFNYPSCQECNCNPDGSITVQCDTNGDCTCKNGFTGSKCDECKYGFGGDKCLPCPSSVTCSLTIDNIVNSVCYGEICLELEGDLFSFISKKTFEFYSCDNANPGSLVVNGTEADDYGPFCTKSGLLLHCTAEDTTSPWHNFVSDGINWSSNDGEPICVPNPAEFVVAGQGYYGLQWMTDMVNAGAKAIWVEAKEVSLVGTPPLPQ